MKLTAQDLFRFGIIDGIITEPQGGAHNDFGFVMQSVKTLLEKDLQKLSEIPIETLLEQRYQKYRKI
jgi:acetyl-CoA carboxylase carboxyl transferase subunit alpha